MTCNDLPRRANVALLSGVALDPSVIPEELLPLLPIAERWGVGDDYGRSEAVDEASPDERQMLVDSVAAAPESLWDWLLEAPRTAEWSAYTCMTMAADEARVTNSM